ncbi:hypothetical protein GH714_005243 [Hevea brasiliensis]|uniref:Uncharacterized protein n=1 Tax=Hevea brasiliensis TaxID=3981 RepID=A0A6A6KNE8_HEVBR|nr:hypothetical protein GH714_005243 [Hevea brasiliensis]
MPTLSQIPEMVPEGIVDIPGEVYMEPEAVNDGFMDLTPIGIGNVSPDPDIDILLENSSFWDELVQSPVPEDIESSSMDGQTNENDVQSMDNGWDKTQHVDQLTEQMGLLTNDISCDDDIAGNFDELTLEDPQSSENQDQLKEDPLKDLGDDEVELQEQQGQLFPH